MEAVKEVSEGVGVGVRSKNGGLFSMVGRLSRHPAHPVLPLHQYSSFSLCIFYLHS